MRSPGQFARTASPEALFVIGGISQYTGAIIAVRLFDDVRPATVTIFRVISAAAAILLVSVRSQRRWTRRDLGAAAIFGIATHEEGPQAVGYSATASSSVRPFSVESSGAYRTSA